LLQKSKLNSDMAEASGGVSEFMSEAMESSWTRHSLFFKDSLPRESRVVCRELLWKFMVELE
jgi:hypothetical protein